MDPRGRSCPLAYRYQPEALAQPAQLEPDTLYVVGGLYGNLAALRTVLVGPDVAGLRMDGEPLHVAVAVAPDLRLGAGASHKRVVTRHPPVVVEPDHLAVMVRQVLGRMRFELAFRQYLAIAERQEQIPAAVEGNLAADWCGPRHASTSVDARPRRPSRRPRTSVVVAWASSRQAWKNLR